LPQQEKHDSDPFVHNQLAHDMVLHLYRDGPNMKVMLHVRGKEA